MVNCKVELNELQTVIVLEALDLYTRLSTGQVKALLSHPAIENLNEHSHKEVERALRELKKAMFPQLKAEGDAMSLRNEQVSMEAKNAYDIMQAMKHSLAMADKKSEHSIWRFEPRSAGNQGLPVCRLQ